MSTTRKVNQVIVCSSVAILLVATSFAAAMAVPISTNIISVQATSGDSSAIFEEVFPVNSFNDILSWSLPAEGIVLGDGEQDLASFTDLNVSFDADPQVDLNFAVRNSNPNASVRITITAATIGIFPGIENAQGAASASVTLTQGNDSYADTGYVQGQFPDSKIYQARYSNLQTQNTQTVFANLVSSMNVLPYQLGISLTETLPGMGLLDMNDTVWMMEAQYDFILSPGDQASGTSTFLVIPEPATMIFLGVAGLAAVIRRRK